MVSFACINSPCREKIVDKINTVIELVINVIGTSISTCAALILVLQLPFYHPLEHIFVELSYPYVGVIIIVAVAIRLLHVCFKDKRCRLNFMRVILNET